MDRSDQAKLINITYTRDALLQEIAQETERTVFCSIQSASRREWEASGQQGLKPEFVVTMFGPDYKGERLVSLWLFGTWQRFTVYRTYELRRSDEIELYLTRDVGTVS